MTVVEKPVALTQQGYIQEMHDTGKVPDSALRPEFDDLLNKHVKIVEKIAQADMPLYVVQAKITADLTLKSLLTGDPARGDTAQNEEDKRFTVDNNGKPLIKLHSIDDIYALPDPTYLIAPIIESISVSLLYGMSGTGKTFTALHLGLSIAHGLQWMGRHVKQGPVWYVNTEGGRSLKKRIKAWYIEHSELHSTDNFKIIPWSLDLREHFQTLLDTIEAMSEQEKPSLIIFDNFSMCTAGIDQTKQEQIAPILRSLNELAQNHECHIMMLHHTNKEDNFNGSMAFRNHVDTMIELKKADKADKNSVVLFCSQKTRDEEPFRDIKTELKQITLYTDEITLQPITSCVVVPSDTPDKIEGLQPTTQAILDILGERSLMHTTWEKECMKILDISKATFNRHRSILSAEGKNKGNKKYVEKYKPEGQKVDHYRKIPSSFDTLQGVEGEGN